MSKPTPSGNMLALYEGQRCIGHLIRRGKRGVEAFDDKGKSLGLYPNQKTAADAISRAAAEEHCLAVVQRGGVPSTQHRNRS